MTNRKGLLASASAKVLDWSRQTMTFTAKRKKQDDKK